MLRIDAESTEEITSAEEDLFYDRLKSIIESTKIDVIIFEDYDKGTITKTLIKKVVDLAEKNQIPTSVDPKKRNFIHYNNVSLFKPNLKELKEGLKTEFNHLNLEELLNTIHELEAILNNKMTLITLSESGIYINSPKERHHIPAHLRDITDVSGAGDTVISVASLCLAKNQSPEVIAQLSNLAGGLVCENVGVVSIVKANLLKEAKHLFQ